MFTIIVKLNLSAVPFAVISVIIGFVYPTVQTGLEIIILFILVLNCYAGYMILILHIIYFGKIVSETGLSQTHHHISKQRFQCYQEAGVIVSYFILIRYSIFFPVSLLVHGFSIVKTPLHPCRGYVEATGIYDGI